MGRRRVENGCGAAVCSKCKAETASAPKGKRHRRCSGQEGAPPRPKDSPIPRQERGRWE